ncbi:MAG TPA: TetR/AcrR family transcriptional regulator [Bacteroidota bacterium]|nr:TetR/AcrR family transcriptional regulator [Bacteroidota bacterium]
MTDTLRERIIEHARGRFFSSGFSKVTMDELSQELGISKKTMYQQFPSKDDLLDQTIEWQIIEMTGSIRQIFESSDDFITKLSAMWDAFGHMACRINKAFLDDVRRHRPDLWKRIEEVRKKNIIENFALMIDEGISRGLIRQDVNKEVVILMYLSSIQGVVNPESLAQYSFSTEDALKTIFRVCLDGILTDKARELFHRTILQNQQTVRQ